MTAQKKLKVTLKRSVIGRPQRQKKIVEALGLRRIHHAVIHNDTPQIRGMINKIIHLIEIEDIQES